MNRPSPENPDVWCPDSAACHHECQLTGTCWRSDRATVFSVYAENYGNRWPHSLPSLCKPQLDYDFSLVMVNIETVMEAIGRRIGQGRPGPLDAARLRFIADEISCDCSTADERASEYFEGHVSDCPANDGTYDPYSEPGATRMEQIHAELSNP